MGRPLKFETVEDLQKQIEGYFETTPREEWTITGLALALDTSRKVLCEYEDDRPEYSNTVKKAKLLVENGYEIDLKRYGRSGTIFALKNFDWRDKTETDITSAGKPIPIYNGLSQHNSNQESLQTEKED
jgi:hypothetical protein